MSVLSFLDQNITVRRLKTVSGNKKAYRATATVDGHIQNLDIEARKQLGIIEGMFWKGWVQTDADIEEGDQLTDKNGVKYKVTQVIKKDYSFGINQHKEIIIEEYNA